MYREHIKPRPDWREKSESLGFMFHSIDGVYWDESVCYRFTADEIDMIEAVTADIHEMCLEAVEYVIEKDLFDLFAIPHIFRDRIAESWKKQEPSLYGRFDLSYKGSGHPKLLEYNADTPTSLLESSVAQWFWMEEVKPGADQFNSLHEKIIARWKTIFRNAPKPRIYMTCIYDNKEDFGTVEYIRDTAEQAGIETYHIFTEDIGWDSLEEKFIDLKGRTIHNLFKLYPWEWMMREEFGPYLLKNSMRIIEPWWKMLLSNKAILPVLWKLRPDHPNLIPSYFDDEMLGNKARVKKPLLSREGANITIVTDSGTVISEDGMYGEEGCIYQAYAPIPSFDGKNYAVVGSWIIGNEPAGICIREDDTPITKNTSRFIPHYFIP